GLSRDMVEDSKRLRQINFHEESSDDAGQLPAGRIVYQAVVSRVRRSEFDRHETVTFQSQAPCLVVINQRFARFDKDRMLGLRVLLGKAEEGSVVEDVAVLIDLNEGRPTVIMGSPQNLLHVL